ncbi:MAG: hypothetical protein RI883_411 [Bacteroidota bacterium]|jgi:hypothetical protein
MKTLLLLFGFITTISTSAFSQETLINQNFNSIRTILTGWDNIRGEWLTSSFIAMSNNQAIPNRTFPEQVTPAQLFSTVPIDKKERVNELLESNERIAANTPQLNPNSFLTMAVLARRFVRIGQTAAQVGGTTMNNPGIQMNPNTSTLTAFSSGEPHIVTFDNRYYKNLMVGEFVLAKSVASNFEVQTRLQALSGDVSFNTAAAMNVGGDKVCVYANEKPDGNNSSSLRINGESVNINNPIYYLPMGGTVSYANQSYTVNWPTGEIAIIEIRKYLENNYLNVAVQVYTSNDKDNDMTGLFGNANNNKADDFASLDGDWAKPYAVDSRSSLFSYSPDITTETYSNRHTSTLNKKMDKLPESTLAVSRKICQEAGVGENDLEGCAFDNAYFHIAPNPRPVFNSFIDGSTLVRLDQPVVNTNASLSAVVVAPVPDKKTTVNPQLRNIRIPRTNVPVIFNVVRIAPLLGNMGNLIIR